MMTSHDSGTQSSPAAGTLLSPPLSPVREYSGSTDDNGAKQALNRRSENAKENNNPVASTENALKTILQSPKLFSRDRSASLPDGNARRPSQLANASSAKQPSLGTPIDLKNGHDYNNSNTPRGPQTFSGITDEASEFHVYRKEPVSGPKTSAETTTTPAEGHQSSFGSDDALDLNAIRQIDGQDSQACAGLRERDGKYKVSQQQHRPQAMAKSYSMPLPLSKARSKDVAKEKPSDASASMQRVGPHPQRPGTAPTSGHDTINTSRSDVDSSNINSLSTLLPLPPFSMPTYLQLELSTDRPSPLYLHSPESMHIAYEPSHVQFQRLLNFLLLPPQLEQVLGFGALTCLDAWLYTFTILPLRAVKAFWILGVWVLYSVLKELHDIASFVYVGVGRIRQRQRRASNGPTTATARKYSRTRLRPGFALSPRQSSTTSLNMENKMHIPAFPPQLRRNSTYRQRAKAPRKASTLQSNHKADLLQGLLIVATCAMLTKFDASRMYHSIRGQAAIKLYVIYNVLEVGDRLLSALGQDILECLFSAQTLDRKPNGRSKVLRPLWMFGLALVYSVAHTTALFYQVITLNVAVNSYSNALLTLLMSNQFVEIKGTVFKKFEKENLFQLTCADVVERFQLWLMLLIIALRNIVEVGGLSITLGNSASPLSNNNSSTGGTAPTPNRTFGIIPDSFTILPTLPFQILGPFLVVLGSEMLVDWLKHAYISKFNATSPKLYGRFLDVLTKDYYSYAFGAQNLTRRLGLPVIPLSCLFIRAALQTYHMFLATNVSAPNPGLPVTITDLSVDAASATTSILTQLRCICERAFSAIPISHNAVTDWISTWTVDDMVALVTKMLFFLVLYLLLLAFKLALGMVLLSYARARYQSIRLREHERTTEPGTKRVSGWGVVELGDDRRKRIYEGDPEGLRAIKERDHKTQERENKSGVGKALDSVDRYSMVAKRIW